MTTELTATSTIPSTLSHPRDRSQLVSAGGAAVYGAAGDGGEELGGSGGGESGGDPGGW